MRVRVGNVFSDPKHVKGGSPQGSILGNYLFCLTTDNLDADNGNQSPTLNMQLATATSTQARIQRNRRRTHPENGSNAPTPIRTTDGGDRDASLLVPDVADPGDGLDLSGLIPEDALDADGLIRFLGSGTR